MAERQDGVQQQVPKSEGIDLFQNREDEGKKPFLGSGCNSSSATRVERLLGDLKLNDAKLDNEDFGLTSMQKGVALKPMTIRIMELEKCLQSLETEEPFSFRRMRKCCRYHVR